jgi:hypothetical protein
VVLAVQHLRQGKVMLVVQEMEVAALVAEEVELAALVSLG